MADGEFRIAGAYVEVNLRDSTAADEQQIRARLESEKPVSLRSALANPDNIEAVKRRIAETPAAKLPVKADNPIDAAWQSKMRASLAAIAKDSLQIPLSPDTAKYREELQLALGEIQSATHQKIPVDTDGADQFKLHVEELAQQVSAEVKAKIKVDVDKDSVDAATKSVDDAAEKMKSSAQTKLSPLMWAGAFAGLPAAAAVGAAGVSAALIGVPALFAGIGAAALKGNEQVAGAFSTTKTQVVDGTQQMASVLAGPLAGAAGDLGASFTRLKPQIQTAMTGSVPAVHTLTGAVTDFAESAMPGMVTAVKSSDAPLQGLRSLAGQAGTGLTEMLTNMSKGSQAAGTSLGTLGGVARDAEGWAGSLLAVLANGSTGVLPQFRATLGQLEGTVLTVAHNAMPALQGASSGFLGTISGGLGIISAAAGALGSWTAPLGSLGGTMFATNSVAKLFGTSLGETGFGLKAFASSVDEAGNKTTPFKTAVSDAKGAGDKFKAGLGALATGFNPLGVALIGGGLLLDAFGQAQQKASEAAAAHRENVRNLTDAIRQDNGVLGAHTQAVNVDALTAKNAASNVAVFGGSLELAKAAIQGNAGALQVMTQKSNDAITSIGKQAGLSDTQIKGLVGLNEGLLKTGGSYDSLGSKVEGYSTKTVNAGRSGAIATDALTEAQRNQLTAIMNGTGAVGEQVKSQRDAYDAYVLSESALTGLTTAQVANRDATVKATQALYDQQNQALGYRGAVLTTQDALTAYNKTLKGGTEEQKAKDLLAVERAFAAQEAAAYNAAYANSAASSPSQKAADAFAAQNREAVKLANSLSGPLPESLKTTLGGFTLAEAAAAGMTIGVNKAGEAVYRLPNGKEIVITGNTKSAQDAIKALPGIADKAGPGVFAVTANTDPATGKTNAAVQYADGSTGIIKIDGNKDPATGQTMVAVQFANGSRGFMTVDAFNQAARDRTIEAKRNADGTVAWIQVSANVAAANAAIDNAARPRYSSISYTTNEVSAIGGKQIRSSMKNATGNVLKPYASGGIAAFASGGMPSLTPMQPLASMVPRNTWRVVGDNMKVPEAYIPIDPASKRSQDLLSETNALMGRGGQGSGPTTVNHNWNITINGADKSNPEIAAAMGSEISWLMRAR